MNPLNLLIGLARGWVPGQLVIQLTDRCNGLCPQCGMRASEAYPRRRLPVDRVKRIIDAAAARGFPSYPLQAENRCCCCRISSS